MLNAGMMRITTEVVIVTLIVANSACMTKPAEGFVATQSPQLVTITPARQAAKARTFRVVLQCDTMDARFKGLQGFRRLSADEAALFVFEQPEIVAFEMKTVAYSIDIIFIAPDNTVIRVERNCKPGSSDLYSSDKPVKWVIETAAGSGVEAGDRVTVK